MITASVRAKYDTAKEAAFGAITSSFTRVGSSFDDQPRIVYIQNFTDQIMDFSISYAGDTVCFSLAPTGTFTTDVTANGAGSQFSPAIGESIWVKYRSTPPTSGFVQYSSVIGV